MAVAAGASPLRSLPPATAVRDTDTSRRDGTFGTRSFCSYFLLRSTGVLISFLVSCKNLPNRNYFIFSLSPFLFFHFTFCLFLSRKHVKFKIYEKSVMLSVLCMGVKLGFCY